jgi:PHD/YefM family antitoxin component YafN of YafNO toxin-antitoxin module
MIKVHPQYIKDNNGKKSYVILPAKEFDVLLQNMEELDDIRLYDQAKKEDDGQRIPMEEAFRMIEAKRNGKKNNDLQS